MSKRIYISGPITGIKGFEKNFEAAENRLLNRGYTVVNPCTLNHDHGKTWEEFMKVDIEALISCDAIAMLSEWEHSRGALLEKLIAESTGMAVLYGI